MRYIAAYMLAVMGGNTAPCAEDLVNILSSVGIEVEQEHLEIVISKLKGKNIEEVMEAGRELLATVSTGTPGAGQNVMTTDNTQHNGWYSRCIAVKRTSKNDPLLKYECLYQISENQN